MKYITIYFLKAAAAAACGAIIAESVRSFWERVHAISIVRSGEGSWPLHLTSLTFTTSSTASSFTSISRLPPPPNPTSFLSFHWLPIASREKIGPRSQKISIFRKIGSRKIFEGWHLWIVVLLVIEFFLILNLRSISTSQHFLHSLIKFNRYLENVTLTGSWSILHET